MMVAGEMMRVVVNGLFSLDGIAACVASYKAETAVGIFSEREASQGQRKMLRLDKGSFPYHICMQSDDGWMVMVDDGW